MNTIAHIGNVPIEEWLPFLVPIIGLYIYGRRRERRRRAAVGRLPAPGEPLSEDTLRYVEQEWRRASHEHVSRALLPLLYPPGPDGFSVGELAERIHIDRATVERQLEELEEQDYLTLELGSDPEDPRASLTFRGFELVDATEMAMLRALARPAEPQGG